VLGCNNPVSTGRERKPGYIFRMVIFYVFLEFELYRNANDGILLYLTFEEVC